MSSYYQHIHILISQERNADTYHNTSFIFELHATMGVNMLVIITTLFIQINKESLLEMYQKVQHTSTKDSSML